jgi:hypothetical protein
LPPASAARGAASAAFPARIQPAVYVRARWYDPELRRFISEDPKGINEGTKYYVFAGSDALNDGIQAVQLSCKKFLKKVIRAAPYIAFGAIREASP